jgi:hypothetical protein
VVLSERLAGVTDDEQVNKAKHIHFVAHLKVEKFNCFKTDFACVSKERCLYA